MGARPAKGRKLRVVTLIDQFGMTGGAERVATEVVTRLDPDRFERILCVSRWTPREEADPLIAPRVKALREAGVRIVGISEEVPRRPLGVGAPAFAAAIRARRRAAQPSVRIELLGVHPGQNGRYAGRDRP